MLQKCYKSVTLRANCNRRPCGRDGLKDGNWGVGCLRTLSSLPGLVSAAAIKEQVEGPGEIGELVSSGTLAANSHGAGPDAERAETAGKF